MHRESRGRRFGFSVLFVALAVACCAPAAGATSFSWIDGYDDPATPAEFDKVGILKEGSPYAKNVLVLVPGTSASAAYFRPLAKLIVSRTHGWQVWSVERRENLLEDHSKLDAVKRGDATLEEFFNYYLGFLTDPSVQDHFTFLPDADVPFARDWGMHVAVEDLRRVIDEANDHGRRVVLGGHSLGGSITTAYATWDFNGRAGAKDLSGLVFVDGGSGPATLTAEDATQRLQDLSTTSPWLTFGGIPSPFAGLFNIVGSTFAKLAPNEVGPLATWPLLPANLRPPVPATNEAGYGYALDTETSPPPLAAVQVHAGRLAAEGDPRPWDPAGELSPIQRVADMFHGTGPARPRRDRVVPPAAAHDRLGSRRRRHREPGAGRARRAFDARPGPAEVPDLRVRRGARRPAGPRRRAAARRRSPASRSAS